jgi:hypothetical protein
MPVGYSRPAPIEKKPRGEAVREHQVETRQESYEQAGGGVPLPMFLFILFIAGSADMVDLVEAIPAVGSVMAIALGIPLGALLWIAYYAAGAKSKRQIVVMAIGFSAEMMPMISALPLNVATAILVQILSQPQVARLTSKTPASTVHGKSIPKH